MCVLHVCFCVHVCVCGSGVWLCAVLRTCVAMCVVVFLRGISFQIAQALPDVFSHQRHCDEARGAQMMCTDDIAASEKYENMFLLPIAIVIISLFSVVLVCVVILISGDTCCDAPVNSYFLPCALFRSTTRRSQRA